MKRLVLAGLLTFAAGQISFAHSRMLGPPARASAYSLTAENALPHCSGRDCATYNPDRLITTTVVPEPATLLLIGSGLVGAGLLFRKKIRGKRNQ